MMWISFLMFLLAICISSLENYWSSLPILKSGWFLLLLLRWRSFLYILDIYPCQKISRQLYWIWIFYWARSKLLKNRETSEACFHQLQLSLWSMNEEYLVFSCDWFLEIHISFHCISLLIVGNWLGSHKITLTWRMLKLCLRSRSVFWENQDTYMWLWALGLWLYSNCGLCFGLL